MVGWIGSVVLLVVVGTINRTGPLSREFVGIDGIPFHNSEVMVG